MPLSSNMDVTDGGGEAPNTASPVFPRSPTTSVTTPNISNNIGSSGSLAANPISTTIKVPEVSRAFAARKNWIVQERMRAVQPYAQASKRAGRIPDENVQTNAWLKRIDGLLSLHEYDFEISPEMRDQAAIHTYLKLMCDDENYHFPPDIQHRAKALYNEYEACHWGAATESGDDPDVSGMDDASPTSLDGSNDAAAVSAGNASVRLPPDDHPIWGLQGIMHGIAPKFGKVKTMVLDRRFLGEKRSANVFGDNGLKPGDWFPNQLVTLFHGGHGSRQGGVYGKTGVGAYSVVVSGHYKDVDKDDGDTIIYSGPNSQTNTDPNNIPQGSARILTHSLPIGDSPGRPVRVFRSATSHEMSPAVGIRYDGLYRITKRLPEQKNARGGLYCRFVLRRVPGQEALSSIWARSPTVQQKRDYTRIWDLTF